MRYENRLQEGTPLDEAASALQKAVRRGQEEVAFYWAWEMCESGFHAYCWKAPNGNRQRGLRR